MPRLAYVYEGIDTEENGRPKLVKYAWTCKVSEIGAANAAGVEEVIYSAGEMILMENRNKQKLGNMADIPVYSIPYPQIKKIAALKIISVVCKNR